MSLFNPHKGSWLGLPDFGITEALGSLLGGSRNQQGGSDLIYRPPVSDGPVKLNVYQPTNTQNNTLDNNQDNPVAPTPSQPQGQQNTNNDNFSVEPSISDVDLNEIYNPALATLGLQQQNATQYRDDSIASLERDIGLQKQRLGDYRSEGEEQIEGQQSQLQNIRENAIQQARRLYNEISQRGNARFGSGSSAGGAFSEIVGRETQKAFSTADSNFQQGFNETINARNNLQRQFNTEMITVDNYYQDTLSEIQRVFKEDINRIEANRNALASAKAQAKVDALVQARDMANQLKLQTEAVRRQVALELEAEGVRLDRQISAYSTALGQSINKSQDYGENIPTGVNSLSSSFNAPAPAQIPQNPYVAGIYTNNPVDDENSLFFA